MLLNHFLQWTYIQSTVLTDFQHVQFFQIDVEFKIIHKLLEQTKNKQIIKALKTCNILKALTFLKLFFV